MGNEPDEEQQMVHMLVNCNEYDLEGLINKGLYDIDQPAWGGWSGRFTREKQKNVWSRHGDIRKDEETYGAFHCYTEEADTWTDPRDGTTYSNEFTPVWRWRRAAANNCIARFDWCVKPYAEANHHPVADVNDGNADTIIRYTAKPGEGLGFDASGSTDPDGDDLDIHWYLYPEAGTYSGPVNLEIPHEEVATLDVPRDAPGKQIHLILEVCDRNPIVRLSDYRRIVIDVK